MVRPLSGEHLLAMLALGVATAGLVAAGRVAPGRWIAPVCWTMAGLILANECSWWAYLAITGTWRADQALPLQLCDAASFATGAALITRRQVLVELAYFWGLAGSVQALLTPDLANHFPHFLFFQYFIAHGGIVAAALFLVGGLGIVPTEGAVVRVALITASFTCLALVADVVTGGNYMYLRRIPESVSLLNLMGPWPWYLVVAAVVAIGLLYLLDLPFRLLRRRGRPAVR